MPNIKLLASIFNNKCQTVNQPKAIKYLKSFK